MNEPHWTIFLTALLTPTIALFGLRIAFMQSRIAKNKLKLDLFDRRYALYQALTRCISTIITEGKGVRRPVFQAPFLNGAIIREQVRPKAFCPSTCVPPVIHRLQHCLEKWSLLKFAHSLNS